MVVFVLVVWAVFFAALAGGSSPGLSHFAHVSVNATAVDGQAVHGAVVVALSGSILVVGLPETKAPTLASHPSGTFLGSAYTYNCANLSCTFEEKLVSPIISFYDINNFYQTQYAVSPFAQTVAVLDGVVLIGGPMTEVTATDAGGGTSGYQYGCTNVNHNVSCSSVGLLSTSIMAISSTLVAYCSLWSLGPGQGFRSGTTYEVGSVTVACLLSVPGCTGQSTFHTGSHNDLFGSSVAIAGEIVVVGAPQANAANSDQGAVYVYLCPTPSTCTATSTLSASDGVSKDAFGTSVAAAGFAVFVGAPNNQNYQGAVYVFGCTQVASCSQAAKLTASDGLPGDSFGISLAADESNFMVVVGAHQKTAGTNLAQGAAYVFYCPTALTCIEGSKLISNDGMPGDEFGWSVAISELQVVVSCNQNQAQVYLFECVAPGLCTCQAGLGGGNCNCPNNTQYTQDGFCVAGCAGSKPFYQQTKCVSSCNNNQYADNMNVCQFCAPPCLSCSASPTYCTVCPSSLPLLQSGNCVLMCSGSTPHLQGTTCVAACSGLTPLLQNGVCVSSCSGATPYAQQSNCVASCSQDAYAQNGVCTSTSTTPTISTPAATLSATATPPLSVNIALIAGAAGGGTGAILLAIVIITVIVSCRARRQKTAGTGAGMQRIQAGTHVDGYDHSMVLTELGGQKSSRSGTMELQQSTRPGSTLNRATGINLINVGDLGLGDVIASGNFGQVFRGTFKGAMVAIKQPAESDDVARVDFFEEARLMNRIPPHPNVVQYFGVCAASTSLYLVMECCDLGSLQTFIRNQQGPLSQVFLTNIAAQIAAGMTHLSAYIVHRDLATRNVLLVSGAQNTVTARIADFGLARPLQYDINGYASLRRERQLPIPWTAGEVLNGQPHTPAADAWSFAVLMWEMFMGCPQYPPQPNRLVMPPLQQPAYCPPLVFGIMTRCWAVAPAQRPSFDAIQTYLATVQMQL